MIIDTLFVEADRADEVDTRRSDDGVTIGLTGHNHRRLTVFLPTDLAAELLGQLAAMGSEVGV